MAQQGPTVDAVSPSGGINTWKRPLLPSGKLSRPGRLVKALIRGSYDTAKWNARHAVHHVRQEADKKVYENIDPTSSEVYHLANQFRRENTDVVGDKPMKNDAGKMSVSKDSKQKAWLEHYQRLLNVEFDWDHQWKACPSQLPLIWLRRLSHRWRWAKHQAHQA